MKIYLTSICILLLALTSNAQNEDYKFTGGVHAGYSLVGTIVKNIAEIDVNNEEDSVDASATPALQLTFDYGLSKVISLGIAVSYQNVSIRATDFFLTDTEGIDRVETFRTNYRRAAVSLRPLFHYGNGDKIDMYSGLRIGILSRGFNDFEGDDIENIDESIFDGDTVGLNGTRFAFTITAFGLRYYFTDNIGAGFEINLGAPYIANVGVSARF